MLLTYGTHNAPSAVYSETIRPQVLTTIAKVGFDRSYERWIRVLEELQALRRLRENWDGQGAASPSDLVLDGAIRLAEFLRRSDCPPPTSAAPTPSGSILITWQGSPYREMEIVAPDYAEVMIVDASGAASHYRIPLPLTGF